jgi:hypothetical protein
LLLAGILLFIIASKSPFNKETSLNMLPIGLYLISLLCIFTAYYLGAKAEKRKPKPKKKNKEWYE